MKRPLREPIPVAILHFVGKYLVAPALRSYIHMDDVSK
jgi:hypothetical protein